MWEAIRNVTGGLSLVAFLGAAGLAAYRIHIRGEARTLETLPDSQRVEAVKRRLEYFDIDTMGLDNTQRYDLAKQQIEARAKRFAISAGVVCLLAGVFACLSAFAIYHTQPEGVPGDKPAETVAFNDGLLKMSDGHWDQADRYFGMVSPTNSHYFEATTRRGQAEFYMRNYAGAEQRFREALSAAKTDDEKLDARYSIARVQIASGAMESARDELTKLISEPRFHNSPEVIFNLASASYDLQSYNQAADLIARFPFSVPPTGDSNRDIWGVAYLLRAKLAARKTPIDCTAIKADVANAQALVQDVLTRMDPQKELLSCLT
jgi:tetratricopeptide (TPR) repeat protein